MRTLTAIAAGLFCMAHTAKAETLPIEEFMPMLQRLMAQPRQSIYKAATV